jgi:hypothetical protein
MISRYSLLDHHTKLPSAPQLHDVDPFKTRVVSVMPLACRACDQVCFHPSVQIAALNVAFQLARIEIERTLCAINPELREWLDEHGVLWPWKLKNDLVPVAAELVDSLARAKELVRLVLLVDDLVADSPVLKESALCHTPYLSIDVRTMPLNEVATGCATAIFVYEEDELTVRARSILEGVDPTILFYRILNLSRGESVTSGGS